MKFIIHTLPKFNITDKVKTENFANLSEMKHKLKDRPEDQQWFENLIKSNTFSLTVENIVYQVERRHVYLVGNKKTTLSKESTRAPRACPECNSDEITIDPTGTTIDGSKIIELGSCYDCDLEWQEVYKFSHITYQ